MPSIRKLTALATALVASPALAQATTSHRHSVAGAFTDAAPPVQLIAVILLLAVIAAPVLLALGHRNRLDALAKGAPLLALAACLFTLLASTVGLANSPVTPPLPVLAPAFAESLLLLTLGALATCSAVVCREWAKPRTTV